MKKKSSGNYIVGRGKPPTGSRFKKGQSGNPSGRPKKKDDFLDEIEEELDQKELVVVHGKNKLMSMKRLLVKSVIRGAVRGRNAKLIEIAMGWVELVDDRRRERRGARQELSYLDLREKLKTMTHDEMVDLYNKTIDEQHLPHDQRTSRL